MGDQLPEVREHLARAQREAARGILPLFQGGREEDVTDEQVDSLGYFYLTLMMGLMAQWSFDPKSAPEAEQLTAGLRRVIEAAEGT